MLEPQKKVFFGSLTTGIGLVGGKGIEYLNRVLVARFFSPEVFGLYSLTIAVLNLGIVASTVGFNTAVPRFVARYSAGKAWDRSNGIFVFSLIILLPVSIIATFSLYLGADWLSLRLFSAPALARLLRGAAPIIPLGACLVVTAGYFQGRREFLLSALYRRAIPRGFFLLALVSLFYAGILDMQAVIAGLGAGYLLSAGLSLLQIVRSRLPKIRPRWNGREVLSYSWPLALTMVFSQLAHRCDLFILAYYLQTAQLGHFNACYTLAALLLLPQALVNKVVLPVMSELIGRDDWSSLKSLYESIVAGLAVLSIPALFLLVHFSSGLIRLLFGEVYVFEGLSGVVGVLAAGNLLGLLAGPNGMLLASMGRTRTQMGIGIASAVLGIGSAVLLIGRFELMGAAIAASLYVVVSNGGGVLFIRRKVPAEILSGRMLKIAFCGATSWLVSMLPWTILGTEKSWIWLIDPIAFFVCYFFFLHRLGILRSCDPRRWSNIRSVEDTPTKKKEPIHHRDDNGHESEHE